MLRAILVLSACLSAAPAFAEPDIGGIIGTIGDWIGGNRPGRPDRPGRPGRPGDGYGGGYNCRAEDEGWEEHRGGHYDCRECLARHGRCVEDCQITEFRCIAQGDRWGRPIQVEEYAYDQREAEDHALWSCHNKGARYCRIVTCDSNSFNERRECVRGGGWGRPGEPGRPGWPGHGRH